MTTARMAALKKAQAASARKRRGTGRAKVSSTRRRNIKRAVVATAAVGATAAGAGYVYKNREKMIVQPMAQRRFVKIAQREKGRKLTKREKIAVKSREKRLHSRRSVDAVRSYQMVRGIAKSSRGKSLNPTSKNYFAGAGNASTKMIDDGRRGGPVTAGRYLFELYRKDVNVRAEHRLNRMKGKKAGFSYKSGKQKKVTKSGRVVRQLW